ncbi:MAG: replication factor C small subunit [Candidatus Micrarchaeota archaeon]
MTDFIPWTEKYRPKTLDEVIGHDAVVKRFKAYADNKNMPHVLLAGRAGIGKTTIVLAMAHELYGDVLRQSFLELNASDERGIDVVRGKIKDFARTLPLADVPFKIIFLDEADSLTPDAQQALRRTMETYSKTCRFCLSCNYSSRIIEPIQSRTAVFRFSPLNDEEITRLVKRVVEGERLEIDESGEKAVVYVSGGDGRKAINCLQGAAVTGGKITEEEVFKVASRAKPKEIQAMVDKALKGDFMGARKLLDELMVRYGMSGEDVLNQVYQEVTRLDVPNDVKIKLVDRVGEYDFRMSEGADERIQLEALLAQIVLAGGRV